MQEPATRYQLAEFAAAFAEPARAAILLALLDDRARPAGELARIAGIGAAGASAHLRQLCDAGLLAVGAQGRHRYYRLAGEDVAHLVETLALASERRPATASTLDVPFAQARTCYRHLAGRIGVALFERLGAVDGVRLDGDAVHLNANGVALLRNAGFDSGDSDLLRLRGRTCLDWTERRAHLSGPLGTRLARGFVERGWLRPRADSRALLVTHVGHDGLRRLGIEPDAPTR